MAHRIAAGCKNTGAAVTHHNDRKAAEAAMSDAPATRANRRSWKAPVLRELDAKSAEKSTDGADGLSAS